MPVTTTFTIVASTTTAFPADLAKTAVTSPSPITAAAPPSLPTLPASKSGSTNPDDTAPGGIIYFCGAPGTSCNERRQSDEQDSISNEATAVSKRFHAANAVATEGSAPEKGYTGEPVVVSVATTVTVEAPQATTGAVVAEDSGAVAEGGLIYFCGAPGSSCNE